jgi:hypothetical protein
MAKLGLRDTIYLLSPPWLRPGADGNYKGVAGKLMYVFGIMPDLLLEKMDQAMRAHMPGLGTPTANPYLASDRQLVQGPSETSTQFSGRLQKAFATWKTAGSALSWMRQWLAYLTPLTPALFSVKNNGAWDLYYAGANTQLPPTHVPPQGNWDWDGVTYNWWRFWAILFSGCSVAGGHISAATNASPIAITTSSAHGLLTGGYVTITGCHGNLAANGYWQITKTGSTTFTLNGSSGSGSYTGTNGIVYLVPATAVCAPAPFAWGSAGIKWGQQPQASWGFNQPPSAFTTPLALIRQWKAAQAWCVWRIYSFDPTLFSPWSPSGGGINPDGTFGSWGTNVDGVWVPSRFRSSRYADGSI